MKKKSFVAALPAAFVSALFVSGSATAAFLSEPPDLPDNFDAGSPPLAELVVTPGWNAVFGTSSATGPTEPADLDDFILVVPALHQVTKMLFFWEVKEGDEVQASFALDGGTPVNVILQSDGSPLETMQPVVNMFSVPLGEGEYHFDQQSISLIGESLSSTASFKFLWKFKVSEVPLPPAAWLLVSGLLAMVGMSRRRQAAAA